MHEADALNTSENTFQKANSPTHFYIENRFVFPFYIRISQDKTYNHEMVHFVCCESNGQVSIIQLNY